MPPFIETMDFIPPIVENVRSIGTLINLYCYIDKKHSRLSANFMKDVGFLGEAT